MSREQAMMSPQVELRYSSSLSLTSALDGVGGQIDALAALPPGKGTRNLLYKRLAVPQGRGCGKSRRDRDSVLELSRM